MKNKILHLLPDDKFTGYAIHEFNVQPGLNDFVVLSADFESIPAYAHGEAKVIAEGSRDYYDLLNEIKQYRAIIFHSLLSPRTGEIFTCLLPGVKVGWVFWGREVYGRKELSKRFLGKKTTSLYYRKRIEHFIKRILEYRPGKHSEKVAPAGLPLSVFRRIDICITDIPGDFEFVKNIFGCSFQHSWYSYYLIEDMLGELTDRTITGQNILLGNSMTLSNNHLEAFETLSKFNLEGRRVIVPLSYGEMNYREVILNAGVKKLNDHFLPLLDFMPLTDFNDNILSCSVCIMNQYRHQALGTTLSALWFGARTYLSNRSTTYNYLRRLGIIIFSVEDDLKPSNPEALKPLNPEMAAINRTILLNEYGRENILLHTSNLIDLMLS
jgi:dTDP-N-acetylfucosamine:lipid II N-acetylfucosaminyltransferase